MPSLPHLPFGLQYAAIGVLLVALLTGVVQQFFADWIQTALGRLWRRLSSRRWAIRVDEWARYRVWVARTYNTMKLGFLQDISIALNNVYVPLQYEQDGQRIDIHRDIQQHLRTVVVGAAGAGKSMLLRHSMLRWAQAPRRFDRVPVLVELARYNRGGRTVQQLIVDTLARGGDSGSTRRVRKHHPARPLVADAEQVVMTALAAGRLCVFLDGLDEVVTDRRADVALDIKEFAEQYPACQIVVTCRDAVYDNDLHPTFDRRIRVAGFDDAGIRHFLRLWFTRHDEITRHGEIQGEDERGDAVGNTPTDPRELVEQLMAALRANPTLMRLARTPLMLTMITSLHDADPGAGPMLTNSRVEFYEQAVTHLLRRDRDLGRHRDLARYRAGHKLMALRAIALAAQGAVSPDGDRRVMPGGDRRVITEEELLAEMSRLLPRFRLVEADLPKMVNEIVDRSGLLIRIDDSNLLYQFAHLTLQEYLAAVELADAPDRLLTLYRENPSRWRETVKLWCAGANRDASDLVREIFAGDARDRLLALECVAEARQIDDALATDIVNQFVARLGTEPRVPDRHLVLAALGAVAGDPGPIGETLFDLLRGQAMTGGPVGEDAIVALAESRRRAAIETLSELALQSSAARAALRSTGELAIPVLASRAGAGSTAAGSIAAVDDLAAIGTPAAATAIAEQLWADGPVATRAAWWLAALIGAPDVESELHRFDPAPFQRGSQDWYDWLWAPFVPKQESRTGIAVTMGRVGWLLDQSVEADLPPDLGTVDPRLALGLGAREGSFSYDRPVVPKAAAREIIEAGQRAGYRGGRGSALLFDARDLLNLVAVTEPDVARHFAVKVVTAGSRTWLSGVLLGQLPAPLVVELAKRLLMPGPGLGANLRDWRALNDRPEQPTLLSFIDRTVARIAVLLAVAAAGIALVRSVGTLIGWWSWGPWWFALLVIVSCAVFAGAFGAFIVDGYGSAIVDGYGSASSDVAAVVGVVSGLVAAVAVGIVALSTVACWLGWFATIGIVVTAAGAVTLFSIWTNRRERAIRNPYRAILQLHERTTQTGATVIASGPNRS